MVIILAVCIPVTALVTGLFTLKGVHMGLKWQYELKHDEKPQMEIKPPLSDTKPQEVELTPNILSEWMNGPQESR